MFMMEYFPDCAANSLWNSDELHPGHNAESLDSTSAPELQTAALNRLIEDKEIAGQAVAIVIRSSQRGLVALCAEMAELLKANRSLQRQVNRLTAENKALRSTSSTSSQPDVCNKSDRSSSDQTSGYLSHSTVAEVHQPPDRSSSNPAFRDMPVVADGHLHCRPRRHRCTQWSSNVEEEVCGLREDVKSALKANAAIVDELQTCRKELKAIRSSEGSSCQLCSTNRPASVPLQHWAMSSPDIRPASAMPARDFSILGCICRKCFSLRKKGFPQSLLQLSVKVTNQRLKMKDVVLLTDGRRGRVRYLGHVDTDPEMEQAGIWIGVELDDTSPKGNDGKVGLKRYFSCSWGAAVFVQLPDIASIEPSHRRPVSTTFYVSDFI